MSKSELLFEQALKVIPGGVNSPVRAYNGVGGTPIFIDRAEGACLIDVDGNSYIDYVGSWGPMICGHANQEIIDAVCAAAHKGLSFGAPTRLERQALLRTRQTPRASRRRLHHVRPHSCR